MRTRALVIVALVLVLGLGAGLAVYLGTRDSKASSPAGMTTESSRTTPKPERPAGRHDRPVPILMYHVVGPMRAGAQYPDLYVSRRDFVAQLRWLEREGYRAVTLDSVYRYWRGLERLPSGRSFCRSTMGTARSSRSSRRSSSAGAGRPCSTSSTRTSSTTT
jgi:hypothetical protein